jgi:hypothetical protein
MGTSTSVSLSLVLFIGLAGAMLLPAVRRWVPRWIEAPIWLGLIASGWLTVTNVQGTSARFLTDSVTWGVAQIVNVSVEILIANFKVWLAEHRYGIASTVLLIALLDFFLLAALESRRQAKKASPRVRLGDWFELPLAELAPASTSVRHALNGWSLPAERTKVVATAGFVTRIMRVMSWGHNSVFIQLKARQAHLVAGGHPVDIRTLAIAESVGPYGPSEQSSTAATSLNANGIEDGPTRLAS